MTGMAPPRAVTQGLAGPAHDFTEQLLSQSSRVYDPIARGTDYVGESEAAGMLDHAESVTKRNLAAILTSEILYSYDWDKYLLSSQTNPESCGMLQRSGKQE